MHNLLLRPANLKQTCSWQDKDGNTPLHYAAYRGYTDYLRHLLTDAIIPFPAYEEQ